MDASAEQEAISHLIIVIRLIGPVVTPVAGIIVGLLAWAWKRMERSQDTIEAALTAHILADDVIHDKLFTDMREASETLEKVRAYHSINHPGQIL